MADESTPQPQHDVPSLPSSPQPKRTKYTEPAPNLSVACMFVPNATSFTCMLTPDSDSKRRPAYPNASYSQSSRSDRRNGNSFRTRCASSTLDSINVNRASASGPASQAAFLDGEAAQPVFRLCSRVRSVCLKRSHRAGVGKGPRGHGYQHRFAHQHIRPRSASKWTGEQT